MVGTLARVSNGLAALSVAAAAVCAAGSATAVELRLASSFPPTHLMTVHMLKPWAEEVDKLSNGQLKINFHTGGELVSGPNTFKRIGDGIADMGYSLQGYTVDQFPRTLLIEVPGVAKDCVSAVRGLWQAHDLIKADYDRTKILALWATGPNVVMSRKDPIRTLEDLKGKRIRSPSSFLGEIGKAMGASPVSMQITEVYQALQTGVLDAMFTGTSAIRGFKLGEVVKYYTDYEFGVSPLFLVMNQRSYDRLSAEHKAIIDRTSGMALSLKGAEVYDREAITQLQDEIKAGRGEAIKISAAERARWAASYRAVEEKLITDLEAKNVPARRIVAAMRAGAGS